MLTSISSFRIAYTRMLIKSNPSSKDNSNFIDINSCNKRIYIVKNISILNNNIFFQTKISKKYFEIYKNAFLQHKIVELLDKKYFVSCISIKDSIIDIIKFYLFDYLIKLKD